MHPQGPDHKWTATSVMYVMPLRHIEIRSIRPHATTFFKQCVYICGQTANSADFPRGRRSRRRGKRRRRRETTRKSSPSPDSLSRASDCESCRVRRKLTNLMKRWRQILNHWMQNVKWSVSFKKFQSVAACLLLCLKRSVLPANMKQLLEHTVSTDFIIYLWGNLLYLSSCIFNLLHFLWLIPKKPFI